jgi:Tfp pilus assembly protein PilF
MTQADEDGYATLLARARKQGYRRSAESTYLQALSIQPGGAEALSGLAMLYLNQGKNTAARDRAREAIRADANNSEAWIVLGAALSATGDAQGAQEAYTKCAALPSGKYVAECRRMVR